MSTTDSTHTASRKILVLRGSDCGRSDALQVLAQLGEIHVADSFDAAMQELRGERFDFVVSQTSDFLPLERAVASQKAQVVLDTIADGVGVIDRTGRILWSNPQFDVLPAEAVQRIRRTCADAFGPRTDVITTSRPVPRVHRLRVLLEKDQSLDVHATPILDPQGTLTQIAVVVHDSTAARRLQQRLDAIDNAGRELVGIDAETIAKLDVGQRLDLLEKKVIRYTRDLMRFDNFAIRLLDKKTQKLDLILSAGLPSSVHDLDLYVSSEGNGISGYVAATGRSYICPDVRQDARYLRGIDNARSSLTVPLRLHDRVIGTFNVESDQCGAFTEDDRQIAEIFGRYVALALNIFNLLAVERYQTTGQLGTDLAAEISGPLNDILSDVTTLREDYIGHDDLRHRLNAIADNVVRIRQAIKDVTRPVDGLVGSRDERFGVDPQLAGKVVLVADDEEVIRETIRDVLARVGCEVETARDGDEAVAMIRQRKYDLVLSDIKMPGRTGYDVFAAVKTACPACPVVFMTGFGYDPSHSVIRAHREGLSGVLFKPFKVDEFLEQVRGALTRAQG